MTKEIEAKIARYIEITEKLTFGHLLDAEVNRLIDEQSAIVGSLVAAGHAVRELTNRPWIEVGS